MQRRRRAAQRIAGPDRRGAADLDAANSGMGEKGLRVLAFAARLVADDELDAMVADPMSLTQDLAFVGMAGMIDPFAPRRRMR